MATLSALVEPKETLSWSLFSLFLLMLILVLIAILVLFTGITSKQNLPPSPSRLPIIGNLYQLGLHPHRSLGSLARHYGPIMLMHLGREPTIVVSSVDMAREIMKTHDITFSNRPYSRIASRLLYDRKDLSLSSYGEYWRQMRSICVLQLLSARRVKSFQSIREEETLLMIKKIEQSSSSPVNLSEMFAAFTHDVICRVAFGRKHGDGEGGKKFKVMLEELGELLGVFDVGDFIPWLAWINHLTGLNARVGRIFKEFDNFLDEVIDKHIALRNSNCNGTRDQHMDFVDSLLEIQKDCSIGDHCMGRDNIKAIVLDMFAGGADTTRAAIEWVMTELLIHVEVMKKAQEEVRGVAVSKAYINEDDICKMHYLKAVIKETLRLHPPLPILLPRQSSKDVEVGGYNIAAKTRVLVNAWAIGRDPEAWEDPEEFKPERFMGIDMDYIGQDTKFIPFGAGRRGCPGSTFAVANVEIVLASLLHKFNWSLPGGARGEDLDVTESTGIAVHRKFPLVAIAQPLPF